MVFKLLFRQPLEIAQTEQVPLQIRLTSHNPPFHEECPLAWPLQLTIHIVGL